MNVPAIWRYTQRIIAALLAKIATLEAENRELKKKAGLNSANSGKPPASDGLKKRTVSLREPGTRSTGGQPGHDGNTMHWCGTPDKTVVHKREKCPHCCHRLSDAMITGSDSRQVFDIPPPRIEVEQHTAQVYCCAHCRKESRAAFPEGVGAKMQYGERVKALGVYFNAQHLIPEDRVSEILRELVGAGGENAPCGPAPASVAKWVADCAEKLRPAAEAIRARIVASPVRHLDETGMRVAGKTVWLHVMSTDRQTAFRVGPGRGAIPRELNAAGGVVAHDHFSAYCALKGVGHAYCHAHHLRELKALIEFDLDKANRMAPAMRDWLTKALSLRDKAGEQGKTRLPRKLLDSLRDEYDAITDKWLSDHLVLRGDDKLAGQRKRSAGHRLVRRFQKYRPDMLRFLTDFSAPFTNNQAERDIRMVKVKMKVAGCFRSLLGAEQFALLRGIFSTARKQGHNILKVLSADPPGLSSLLCA